MKFTRRADAISAVPPPLPRRRMSRSRSFHHQVHRGRNRSPGAEATRRIASSERIPGYTSGILKLSPTRPMFHRAAILTLVVPLLAIGIGVCGLRRGSGARWRNGDYATALIELQPLADQGHPGSPSACLAKCT